MQGEKSTEEQAMLERKISELQEQFDRKRDDHSMLKSQTKQIEEEKRRLIKSLGEISREKITEQGKIEELELHAENAQRLLRKLNDDKEVRRRSFRWIQRAAPRRVHLESLGRRASDAYRDQASSWDAQRQGGHRDESGNPSTSIGNREKIYFIQMFMFSIDLRSFRRSKNVGVKSPFISPLSVHNYVTRTGKPAKSPPNYTIVSPKLRS